MAAQEKPKSKFAEKTELPIGFLTEEEEATIAKKEKTQNEPTTP